MPSKIALGMDTSKNRAAIVRAYGGILVQALRRPWGEKSLLL